MMHLTQVSLPEILTNLFNNTNEKVFIFDRNGKVILMNPAAKDILKDDVFEEMVAGNPKAICKTCRGFTTEEELRTCKSCYVMDSKEDVGSFQVYLDTIGKGVVPYIASIQTIDHENGIRVLMLRDLYNQMITQEMLQQKLQVNQVMTAQEEERKRISRELHDSVAQEMLSLLVEIRLLKYMTKDKAVVHKVRQTEGTLMRLLEDIQHLSVELRPATLDDLGLEAAFRAHFKSIEKNYGFIVHFTSQIGEKRYEGEVETAVYRICQEAVLNAIKYAKVDDLAVELSEKENVLILHIRDQGCGFKVDKMNPQGTGLGLYGMKERAELIRGTLTIQSELEKGTEVILHVPLKRGNRL